MLWLFWQLSVYWAFHVEKPRMLWENLLAQDGAFNCVERSTVSVSSMTMLTILLRSKRHCLARAPVILIGAFGPYGNRILIHARKHSFSILRARSKMQMKSLSRKYMPRANRNRNSRLPRSSAPCRIFLHVISRPCQK